MTSNKPRFPREMCVIRAISKRLLNLPIEFSFDRLNITNQNLLSLVYMSVLHVCLLLTLLLSLCLHLFVRTSMLPKTQTCWKGVGFQQENHFCDVTLNRHARIGCSPKIYKGNRDELYLTREHLKPPKGNYSSFFLVYEAFVLRSVIGKESLQGRAQRKRLRDPTGTRASLGNNSLL